MPCSICFRQKTSSVVVLPNKEKRYLCDTCTDAVLEHIQNLGKVAHSARIAAWELEKEAKESKEAKPKKKQKGKKNETQRATPRKARQTV